MKAARTIIGGLGNLMFIKAYLIGQCMEGEISDTYVQQYSRWKQWAPQIKATFMEGIKPGSLDKVSLHIRRGDYLKAGIYVNLAETDYYQKAVVLFPEETFLVFCKDNQGWEQDKADREWCRQFLDTFIPGRYELVNKDNKEEEDLNMMASTTAIIMANSSFSWWAAFLGEYPGKKIITPKEWFVPGSTAQPVELLPTWKQL